MTAATAAAIVVLALGVAGCATDDFLAAAQKSMSRAARLETPEVYFAGVLARVAGDPPPAPVSWQARQHYLAVIFNLEGIQARSENTLKREGKLGDAFVLKALAQWRLGRMADARASALRAEASGQEALDADNRALFRAFQGVARLDAAHEAYVDGRPFSEIETLILGETGAWRMLGRARTEVTGQNALQQLLILSRLATHKVLRDARTRATTGAAAPKGATSDEDWKRMQAEAQVELSDLAALFPTPTPAQIALVRRWADLCGLSRPSASR